jgi:hypothetical protein
MAKIAGTVALLFGAALATDQRSQRACEDACASRCYEVHVDLELQREEITSLEREAARAIQLNNGTFFRRVYADEYAGTLSHGQAVNKTQWIEVIQSPVRKYETFNATDIDLRLFEETAIATCVWSARAIVNGQVISGQMRAIHVYVNTPQGWHVVSGQVTNLPPDAHLAL